MSKVSMAANLGVPPQQVWELIGNFSNISSWHPAVEKDELEDGGTVRRLHLVGGGEIVEKLEPSEGEKTYRYSIVSSPLPVMNYSAQIRVIEDGDGARVEWTSEFDPSAGATETDAVAAIQGVYQAGFDNLKKMFGG